jgi:hypothetical protein
VFITFGIAGLFERDATPAFEHQQPDGSTVSWAAGTYGRMGTPLGNAGVGFKLPAGKRNAFRCDVQGIIGVDHDFVATIRVMVSYSIPIGREPGSQ